MVEKQGAILVAEIGSLITRVTLVDSVDGEARIVGRAETFSSIEPPYQNALFAILEAAAQLSETTGRTLLRDGQLLMPQNSERDGIDRFIAITSAAGPMALVITAIASDVSAHSAVRASRAIYATLLQVVTLDDAASQSLDNDERSWIERQVETLLGLQPDAVFISGGLEGGAVDAVNRLAHIVGLTALRSLVDSEGLQRQDVVARPVIYAGNSEARERVLKALSDRAQTHIVDNLRPALDRENLDPARAELARLYDEYVLSRLPGMAALRRLSRVPVRSVCSVSGTLTRFIAERYGRRVLNLDVGALSSSALLAGPGRFTPAVLGNCGTVYGLSSVMVNRGMTAIARWLPFPISESELTHRLLNRMLRPQLLPASRQDLYVELAVAREALGMVFEALCDEQPEPAYDLVIAGGALARVPHPGFAALLLLDILQPARVLEQQGASSQLALDMHLDTLGMLPVCGALAGLDPVMAVTVFDHDALRNMPLATCVTALGEGRAGEVALKVELSVVGGRGLSLEVRHGQIARIPLAQGMRGTLALEPASGVRIGNNAPGVAVRSDQGAISGSALGVVIDARGRPLLLPQDERERCARIWEWLVALGAERGASPYVEAPEPVVPVPVQFSAPTAPALPTNGVAAMLTGQREPPVAALPPAIPAPQPPPPPAPVAPLTPEPAPAAKRISLSDLPAQEEPGKPLPAPPLPPPLPVPEAGGVEAGGPGKGRRVSLSDLAQETPTPPLPLPVPEAGGAEAGGPGKGKRISLSDLAAQEEASKASPPAPPPGGLEGDLAKLRQSVEEPKKRGLFGRKK